MVSSKRAPVLSTCEPHGLVAASLRPDGSVRIHDLTRPGKPPGYLKPPVDDRAPMSALVLMPKTGSIAACADRAGNVTVLAHIDSPPEVRANGRVATLVDPPRPIALDASNHFVVAAGGRANELVVFRLRHRPDDVTLPGPSNKMPAQSTEFEIDMRKSKKLKLNLESCPPIATDGNPIELEGNFSTHPDVPIDKQKMTSDQTPSIIPFSGLKEYPHRFPLTQYHRSVVSAVALAPDNRTAVVCCQAISRIDLATGNLVEQFAGHQSIVTAVRFLPQCGPDKTPEYTEKVSPQTLFATACAGDQFVSIWRLQSNDPSSASMGVASESPPLPGTKRRSEVAVPTSEPYHTLVAPEKGAHFIAVDHHIEPSARSMSVAALLPSGSIAVWKNWNIVSAAQTTKCTFQIMPSPDDVVFFAGFPDFGRLCVGRGHAVCPTPFWVSLAETSGNYRMPRVNTGGLLASEQTGDMSFPSTNVHLVRAEAKASNAIITAPFDAHVDVYEDKVSAGDSEHPPGTKEKSVCLSGFVPDASDEMDKQRAEKVDADSQEHDLDSENNAEPTFEERLALLGVPVSRVTTSSRQPLRTNFSDSNNNCSGEVDSFANVISQAIRSKDDKLLISVLASSSKLSQIRQTVSRMPVELATNEFLDILATDLLLKSKKARLVLPWIKTIVLEHASTLMNRKMTEPLDRLVRSLGVWVEGLPDLRRLEGQLELVLAQADRVRNARKSFTNNVTPVSEYVERAVQPPTSTFDDPIGSDSKSEENADGTGDCSDDEVTDSSTWEEREGEDDEDDEDYVDDAAAMDDSERQRSKNA